jgi:hypothetical protein
MDFILYIQPCVSSGDSEFEGCAPYAKNYGLQAY